MLACVPPGFQSGRRKACSEAQYGDMRYSRSRPVLGQWVLTHPKLHMARRQTFFNHPEGGWAVYHEYRRLVITETVYYTVAPLIAFQLADSRCQHHWTSVSRLYCAPCDHPSARVDLASRVQHKFDWAVSCRMSRTSFLTAYMKGRNVKARCCSSGTMKT